MNLLLVTPWIYQLDSYASVVPHPAAAGHYEQERIAFNFVSITDKAVNKDINVFGICEILRKHVFHHQYILMAVDKNKNKNIFFCFTSRPKIVFPLIMPIN